MKSRSITFLSINIVLALTGFGFSFGSIFLEENEFRYSITEGHNLFNLVPNVWVVLSAILLFVIILSTIAMFTMYVLLKKHNKKEFWKWYLILSLILAGLLILFVIFAVNVCLSKSVFGFGLSTDYKFNMPFYMFIILIGSVIMLNIYNALDTNKKLLK